MNETELVEFIIMLFSVGIVMMAYYPPIFNVGIQIIAFVGAFYLVGGVTSHLLAPIVGRAKGRKDDWWNGAAILLVVVLIFGRVDLAMGAVNAFVMILFTVIFGSAAFLHTLLF